MPSAASESGTKSVSMIDANASENAVHSTTRQKISQTWLASHTGPIEWLDHRAGPVAPLGAARGEVPEPGAEVGAAEQRVRGDAEEQDDGDDVGHQTPHLSLGGLASRRRLARAVRPVGLERRSPASRNRRLIMRRISTRRDRHADVDADDHDERDPHARRSSVAASSTFM